MIKLLLIQAIFLLLHYNLQAQENYHPFLIKGNINADSGMVTINLLYDQHEYYPSGVEQLKAEVKNGRFSIVGRIPYPQAFTLKFGQRYYSSLFIIEPGEQSMVVNLDHNRVIPLIENKSMQEHREAYAKAFANIKMRRDKHKSKKDSLRQLYENAVPDSIQLELEIEMKEIYTSSDSALLNYVHVNPDSYLAFWRLTELFIFDGGNPIFNSIINRFSNSLKNTITGKVLAEKLAAANALLIWKKFPGLDVVDAEDNPVRAYPFSNCKFTFVDFWYSYCSPCIAQFPHLGRLYTKYKDLGLNIIGISTDKESDKGHWQKIIKKYEITWPQYWDKNCIESSKLSINKFPTNYLLDSQGIIIKKDLKPVELDLYLQENL